MERERELKEAEEKTRREELAAQERRMREAAERERKQRQLKLQEQQAEKAKEAARKLQQQQAKKKTSPTKPVTSASGDCPSTRQASSPNEGVTSSKQEAEVKKKSKSSMPREVKQEKSSSSSRTSSSAGSSDSKNNPTQLNGSSNKSSQKQTKKASDKSKNQSVDDANLTMYINGEKQPKGQDYSLKDLIGKGEVTVVDERPGPLCGWVAEIQVCNMNESKKSPNSAPEGGKPAKASSASDASVAKKAEAKQGKQSQLQTASKQLQSAKTKTPTKKEQKASSASAGTAAQSTKSSSERKSSAKSSTVATTSPSTTSTSAPPLPSQPQKQADVEGKPSPVDVTSSSRPSLPLIGVTSSNPLSLLNPANSGAAAQVRVAKPNRPMLHAARMLNRGVPVTMSNDAAVSTSVNSFVNSVFRIAQAGTCSAPVTPDQSNQRRGKRTDVTPSDECSQRLSFEQRSVPSTPTKQQTDVAPLATHSILTSSSKCRSEGSLLSGNTPTKREDGRRRNRKKNKGDDDVTQTCESRAD